MNREILRLAIPSILSNLSIPLMASVDVALMGREGGSEYLAGLMAGTAIFNTIFWGLGFLRMGTTGMVAQAFGENAKTKISVLLGQTCGLALVIGLILVIFQAPILAIMLKGLGGTAIAQGLASQYFKILIFSAPAVMLSISLNGWYFGMQNARFPMYVTIFENLVNIGLSIYFVKVLNWGIPGVAYGTLIARYSGVLLSLILFFSKYKNFALAIESKSIFAIEELRKFFNINGDIFLRTLCLIGVFFFFDAVSLRQGDTTAGINSVYRQFMGLLSYGVDGFAFAAESLVGKYVGAKDKVNFKLAIKRSFQWGIGLGLIYSLVFGFGGEALFHLFTDDPEIINGAKIFLIWLIIMSLLNSIAFIWDGIYIGATASKEMRNTMFFSVLIFLAVYFISFNILGNHGLWLAMAVFMLSRSIFQSIIAPKSIMNRA